MCTHMTGSSKGEYAEAVLFVVVNLISDFIISFTFLHGLGR